MDISIVIPVYNENGNSSLLHEQLVEVMDRMKNTYEIIFVDDGSTDNTFLELSKLKKVLSRSVCVTGASLTATTDNKTLAVASPPRPSEIV